MIGDQQAQIQVSTGKGQVVITFSQPVVEIALPPEKAMALGKALHAAGNGQKKSLLTPKKPQLILPASMQRR